MGRKKALEVKERTWLRLVMLPAWPEALAEVLVALFLLVVSGETYVLLPTGPVNAALDDAAVPGRSVFVAEGCCGASPSPSSLAISVMRDEIILGGPAVAWWGIWDAGNMPSSLGDVGRASIGEDVYAIVARCRVEKSL